MEEQIIRLEEAEKAGIIECLKLGIKAIFRNFMPIVKTTMPCIDITVATFLMMMPAFFVEKPELIKWTVPFVVLGIVYMLYGFWQYLIGLSAVSYMAKDAFENKEIKTRKEYLGYVTEHKKSYVKYWLWLGLAYIIFIGISCGLKFCFDKLSLIKAPIVYSGLSTSMVTIPAMSAYQISAIVLAIILFVITIPLSIGLSMSYLFWAYGDKNNTKAPIIQAVKICYKKPFNVLIYFLLLGIFAFILMLPLMIILLGVSYGVAYGGTYLYHDIKNYIIITSIVAQVLQNYCGYIAGYFMSFGATRYYFSLIKSNDK